MYVSIESSSVKRRRRHNPRDNDQQQRRTRVKRRSNAYSSNARSSRRARGRWARRWSDVANEDGNDTSNDETEEMTTVALHPGPSNADRSSPTLGRQRSSSSSSSSSSTSLSSTNTTTSSSSSSTSSSWALSRPSVERPSIERSSLDQSSTQRPSARPIVESVVGRFEDLLNESRSITNLPNVTFAIRLARELCASPSSSADRPTPASSAVYAFFRFFLHEMFRLIDSGSYDPFNLLSRNSNVDVPRARPTTTTTNNDESEFSLTLNLLKNPNVSRLRVAWFDFGRRFRQQMREHYLTKESEGNVVPSSNEETISDELFPDNHVSLAMNDNDLDNDLDDDLDDNGTGTNNYGSLLFEPPARRRDSIDEDADPCRESAFRSLRERISTDVNDPDSSLYSEAPFDLDFVSREHRCFVAGLYSLSRLTAKLGVASNSFNMHWPRLSPVSASSRERVPSTFRRAIERYRSAHKTWLRETSDAFFHLEMARRAIDKYAKVEERRQRAEIDRERVRRRLLAAARSFVDGLVVDLSKTVLPMVSDYNAVNGQQHGQQQSNGQVIDLTTDDPITQYASSVVSCPVCQTSGTLGSDFLQSLSCPHSFCSRCVFTEYAVLENMPQRVLRNNRRRRSTALTSSSIDGGGGGDNSFDDSLALMHGVTSALPAKPCPMCRVPTDSYLRLVPLSPSSVRLRHQTVRTWDQLVMAVLRDNNRTEDDNDTRV